MKTASIVVLVLIAAGLTVSVNAPGAPPLLPAKKPAVLIRAEKIAAVEEAIEKLADAEAMKISLHGDLEVATPAEVETIEWAIYNYGRVAQEIAKQLTAQELALVDRGKEILNKEFNAERVPKDSPLRDLDFVQFREVYLTTVNTVLGRMFPTPTPVPAPSQ